MTTQCPVCRKPAPSHLTDGIAPHENPDHEEFPQQFAAVELETAPEVLRTPTEGLTNHFNHSEGMAAMQSTEVLPAELQERALVLLGEVCKNLERNQLHKVHYIKLAREYGCTFDQIAAEMRMSPSGVRYILKMEERA